MSAVTQMELPSEAVRTAASAWGLITAIGAEGRAFRLSEIEARVTAGGAKAKAVIRHTIKELMAAGNLTRCDGNAIASRNATYRLEHADPPKALLPPVGAFVSVGVHVQIPRTHDGLWALFLWLDKNNNGGFTASQAVRLVGDEIASEDVRAYVRALIRGGYLVRQEERHDPLLRVARRQIETPLVNRAQAIEARRRDVMWRTMKMSTYFTATELAHAASTRNVDVGVAAAAAYCAALHTAGYLLRKGDTFRLRPGLKTGAQPPQVLRARFVWDPNECRVIGPAVIEGRRA